MLTDIGEAFGIQIRMPGSARTEHDLQSGVLAKSWIMLHAAWDMHEHGPAASRSVIAKCHEWTRFRTACRELAFAPNTKEPPTPRSFEAALASNRASWSSRLINEVRDRTVGATLFTARTYEENGRSVPRRGGGGPRSTVAGQVTQAGVASNRRC